MKKVVVGVLLFVVLALLVAALPHTGAQDPVVMKFSDRCRAWVGARFQVNAEGPYARLDPKGSYTLVVAGVDYLEFEAARERILVPLNDLVITSAK